MKYPSSVGWRGANCFSIRVSISIQTQKWEIWDTHFGSLECPFSHIYIGKMCARSFILVFWDFFVIWVTCHLLFTSLGSTTRRRMSSYESSGVDFFLILFHQCSRLLQFALDDRRNKNFSGVGRMNVLLRQERYDVCRIHLNNKKKGSEKLFFFRVWADARDQHHLLFWLPLPQNSAVVCVFYTSSS